MKLFEVFMDDSAYRASCLGSNGKPDAERVEELCGDIFGRDLEELSGYGVVLTIGIMNGSYRVALSVDDVTTSGDEVVTGHHIAVVDDVVFSAIESNEALKSFVLGKIGKEKVSTEIPTAVALWHKATCASSMNTQPGVLTPAIRLTDKWAVASIKAGTFYSTALN